MKDFTLDRTCAADPETVWAHFTEPDLMARWFCPNPAMDVTCTLDVRPGGSWRCDMGPYGVSGVFVEVEPCTRVAFTWAWDHEADPDSTVIVTLTPERNGTRLVLEHAESTPDVGQDGHESGWVITLGRLADVIS